MRFASRKTNTVEVTFDRLRELLDYNPRTGMFIWKLDRPGRIRAGDEAGTVNTDGTVVIGLDGRLYSASRLAWMYVTGDWPKERLQFIDRDKQNLKYHNLSPFGARHKVTKAAVNQRRWRAKRKRIITYIRARPELLAAWHQDAFDVEDRVKTILLEQDDRFPRDD